jgi:hypothetical protein
MCSKIFENVISPFCGTGSLIGIGALKETFFGVGDAGVPCARPLSQTNFFPDLTHVNFLLAAIEVEPSFVHVAPALGAVAKLCAGLIKLEAMAITTNPVIFFMS